MKRNIIVSSHSITLRLATDTTLEREAVSSSFGPVKAGLITLPTIQPVQPTESRSYLVRQAKTIEFRYSEVCVTLKLDTEAGEAVVLLPFTIDTTGTDVLE